MTSPFFPTILLFLKAPRPGFVKTRLAKDIGDEAACDIYRELVAHTLSQIPSDWPLRVHFAPAEAESEMRDWLGEKTLLIPQPEGDLGHRLTIACEQAFAQKASGVVLLGGDCPGLTTQHLTETAELLAQGQSAIGPAEDGGYWLLGLPNHSPELFYDIPWSTSEVLPLTLKIFAQNKQNPHHLEVLEDIDDLECLQRHFPEKI